MSYFIIFISAVFVNNIVLSQFLGICPFLGVSKKLDTAMGMSAAVAFVMVLATLCTFLIQNYVLVPLEIGFIVVNVRNVFGNFVVGGAVFDD